jgi:FtsZ-binding cell division protein ZapB
VSEHISEQDSERYRKRVMTSDELFATSFHLAVCDACHNRFAGEDILEPTYTFIRDELKAAQDEDLDHIGSEQLAAYVDQKLSWPDREVVETHFEVCSQCNLMAEKLRLNSRSFGGAHAPDKPSSRASIGRVLAPAWGAPIQIAGAALAGALLVWLVAQPLRSQVAGLRAEIEELRRTNATLNQEITTLGSLEVERDQYARESERLRHENEASQAVINRLEKDIAQKQVRSPMTPVFSSLPVVTLNDESGPVILNEKGNITGINSLAVSYQRLIKTALTTGRVKTPPLIGTLRGKSSRTMGAASSTPFALLTPRGTVIESDRPTFRWQSLAEASGYTVTLLDSRLNKVVTSPLLHTSEWQMPSRLKRGGIYSWQVKAVVNGREVVSPSGPAPDVRFKILEQTGVDELERAKKDYRDSHLTLGIINAQMGLVDEAEKEFESLARLNPSSAAVQRMLRSLQALKR